MTSRFGIFVPQGWKMDLTEIADPVEQWEAMTNVAKRADEGSWDSIWLFDHFHTVPEPSDNTTFECWSATAALARDTQRVNIGQMVGCNGYRNPALYAKIASTVDVASHGRLYAGIGAGWYEHEWKAYGYEWTDVKPRMAAFREATEIIWKMWTEDKPVYNGKHYSIDAPINLPKGAGNTRPQFWIGGGGPQVTLKLVAQYADAANIGGGNPEVIKEKVAILRGHCEKVGRDYDEITKSTGLNVFPIDAGDDPKKATEKARGPQNWDKFSADNTIATEDEIALKVEAALEAGADYVIFYVPGVAYDLDLVDRVERVAKRFA
ncbi:TIGR03560 family F420-dependent LLM class oxidoreductase [Kribbella lupini]|uniref:LLM class F420-dependent oxidoreductase n=1 Tax=Kribbella lupini TaxID=291602 RepID=A0ABN2CDL4_9ACTN